MATIFGLEVAPPTEFTEAEVESGIKDAMRQIQNSYRYATERGFLQETRKALPDMLRQLAKSLED